MKITHDVHTHTFQTISVIDPKASVINLIAKAAELGHTVLGISNHMWDSSVPTTNTDLMGQPEQYVLLIKNAIPDDTKGVKILIGAESEYCALSDTLAVTPETAELFDYVLIRHSHTRARNFVIAEDANTLKVRAEIKEKFVAGLPELSEAIIDKMVNVIGFRDANAISAPEHDQLALVADFLHSSLDGLLAHPNLAEVAKKAPTAIIHPFWPDGSPADEAHQILKMLDYDRMSSQFKTCAELGVAVVVNTGVFASGEDGYESDPMVKIIRLAIDAGCRVVFGSNALKLDGLEDIQRAGEIADAIGITEADLADFVR